MLKQVVLRGGLYQRQHENPKKQSLLLVACCDFHQIQNWKVGNDG